MINILTILCMAIFLFDAGLFSQIVLSNQTQQSVLAAEVIPTGTTEPTDSPNPTTPLTPTPTSSPSAHPTLSKKSYSIALFGDSMIDTMGENLEYLQKELSTIYPETNFKLYNYGIGGQNVSMGLARFDSSFTNRERSYPPISQINADVIIIGSFAYNPYSPHDPTRHYSELTTLAQKAKAASKQTYMLAEIAPLDVGFGKGPHGVNWPEAEAHEHALKIIQQLENAHDIAKKLALPLIDATTPSISHGKFGEISLVNSDDDIHPSVAGHLFTARIIARTIKLK